LRHRLHGSKVHVIIFTCLTKRAALEYRRDTATSIGLSSMSRSICSNHKMHRSQWSSGASRDESSRRPAWRRPCDRQPASEGPGLAREGQVNVGTWFRKVAFRFMQSEHRMDPWRRRSNSTFQDTFGSSAMASPMTDISHVWGASRACVRGVSREQNQRCTCYYSAEGVHRALAHTICIGHGTSSHVHYVIHRWHRALECNRERALKIRKPVDSQPRLVCQMGDQTFEFRCTCGPWDALGHMPQIIQTAFQKFSCL
jgi:hypothetical protein